MTRLKLFSAMLAVGAILASTVGMEVSTATTTSNRGALGADITIKAHNTSNRDLYVVLERSEVRTKQLVAGPWSTLDTKCPLNQMHLQANADIETTTCELDLSGNLQRQYKFLIQEKVDGRVVNTQWVYFPSANDWAASNTRTIGLGDISRHF